MGKIKFILLLFVSLLCFSCGDDSEGVNDTTTSQSAKYHLTVQNTSGAPVYIEVKGSGYSLVGAFSAYTFFSNNQMVSLGVWDQSQRHKLLSTTVDLSKTTFYSY